MRSWYGRGKPLQIAVTACCLVAFVLFGYDQGVFGGILQNKNWLDQFGHPPDTLTGLIVSCYNLGCLTGCIINFFIGPILGRRRAIWLAMGLVIIGATLQTSAFTVPHLIIGRVVTGFGTGIKTSTVPMYQAELCDKASRGRLISSEVLFVGVGIVFAYWFDFGMSFAGGALAWRIPIALQILFAIFVVFLVFGLPESPRWLCKKGRWEEAEHTLCAVFDKEPTDEYIIAEMDSIRQAIALDDKADKKSILSVIVKKDAVNTRRRILLAWGAQFMNQVGGINLVVYYIPTVLVENVHMSAQLAQILGGCINMMFMIGSILPSLRLDTMGRRKTMFWGCTGLGICMLMISALLSQSTAANGQAFASASVTFFFLYMLIFGATVNCVPWVYVPEILPIGARAEGTAIGVSSNWLWNFVIVMITPIIIKRLQWKAYLIFMATNFAFVPIFYWFYPETSNLRLEDIDLIFTDGKDPVKAARRWQKAAKAGRASSVEYDAEKPSVGVDAQERKKSIGAVHTERVGSL